MKPNMGTIDRAVRLQTAILIGILFLMERFTNVWGIVLLMLAGILLLTSILSFCPLYVPFGLSTKKTNA